MVKQMLYQAKLNNLDKFYQNTVGIVCFFLIKLTVTFCVLNTNLAFDNTGIL